MVEREFIYDVFISYRHVPLDKTISGILHKNLETYQIPSKLKALGYQDIKRVFRDEEELPLSGILSDTISYALVNSHCLVVVCSKDTPASQWVNMEISQFIRMGKAGSIFALLIDGTPESSFPEALRRIPDIGDRILTIKSNTKKQKIYELNHACTRIVAEALNCPYERFVKEVGHSKIRKHLVVMALIAFALSLTGFAAFLQLNAANQSYEETEKERTIILSMLGNVAYGFANDPESFKNSYEEMAETIDENALRIENIIEVGGIDLDTITLKVHNYINLSATWQRIGNMEKALQYADNAINTAKEYSLKADYQSILSLNSYLEEYKDPDEAGKRWGTDLVISFYNLKGKKLLADAYLNSALIHLTAGLYSEACSNCYEGKAIYDDLELILEDTNVALITEDEKAAMYACLGKSYLCITSFDYARKYLEEAIKLYDVTESKTSEYYYNKGDCQCMLGLTYLSEGNIKKAITYLEEAEDNCYCSFNMDENSDIADEIASCSSNYALALIMNNEPELAVEKIEKAYEIWEPYNNPNSLINQYSLILMLQYYAYGLGKSGDTETSLAAFSDLEEQILTLCSQDETNLALKYQMSQVLYLEGYLSALNIEDSGGVDTEKIKASVDIMEEVYEKSGYAVDYAVKYGSNMMDCGMLMAYAYDYDTADLYFQKAENVYRELSEGNDNKAFKARYHYSLSWRAILSGDTTSALSEIQQAEDYNDMINIRFMRLLLDFDEYGTDVFNKELDAILEECPYLDDDGSMILDIIEQLEIAPVSNE